jgi:hypothetical protein
LRKINNNMHRKEVEEEILNDNALQKMLIENIEDVE